MAWQKWAYQGTVNTEQCRGKIVCWSGGGGWEEKEKHVMQVC